MTTLNCDEYRKWSTEELQEHSGWLYQEYLKGEDVLGDLHEIAEILRERIPDAGAR